MPVPMTSDMNTHLLQLMLAMKACAKSLAYQLHNLISPNCVCMSVWVICDETEVQHFAAPMCLCYETEPEHAMKKDQGLKRI